MNLSLSRPLCALALLSLLVACSDGSSSSNGAGGTSSLGGQSGTSGAGGKLNFGGKGGSSGKGGTAGAGGNAGDSSTEGPGGAGQAGEAGEAGTGGTEAGQAGDGGTGGTEGGAAGEAGTGTAGGTGGTSAESTPALCADGQDNDEDNFIDCEDKNCCAVVDCKTTAPDSYCGKQGSGGTGGSAGSSGTPETSVALCVDKVDNDGDNFIDCNDKDCCKLVDCSGEPTSYCAKQGSGGTGGSSGTPENTVALCGDGSDNDGDNFIDCNDKDCCKLVDCSGEPTSYCAKQGSGGTGGSGGSSSTGENTIALCSDGITNDSDKFVDCDDFECCALIDCKAKFPQSSCALKGSGGSSGTGGAGGSSSTGENTVTLCSDGITNDGDKFVDCDDFECCDLIDCKGKFPQSSCALKGSGGSGGSSGTKENTLALCTDGINNDNDQFTDCDDFDCCVVANCTVTKPGSACALKNP